MVRFGEVKFIYGYIDFGALMKHIQSRLLLFADTLLRNLCKTKTSMWV